MAAKTSRSRPQKDDKPKTAAKKTSAKSSKAASAKKGTTKKSTTTKKTAAKKTAPKKAASKKPVNKKSVEKKTSTKKTASKKSTAANPAKKAAAPKTAAKKDAAKPKKAKSRSKASARLEDLKAKLISERDKLLDSLGNDNKRLMEMSGHGDLVDQSNDFRERELLMGMAEHDRERLVAINEALALVEQGAYGMCLMCEEEIPEARLMAVPTAKYCIKCQSAVESGGGPV